MAVTLADGPDEAHELAAMAVMTTFFGLPVAASRRHRPFAAAKAFQAIR